jgi:hypothetical protein
MEAVRTSEKFVNLNLTTRQYIPEDSKLYTRLRENLKSHKLQMLHRIILSQVNTMAINFSVFPEAVFFLRPYFLPQKVSLFTLNQQRGAQALTNMLNILSSYRFRCMSGT